MDLEARRVARRLRLGLWRQLGLLSPLVLASCGLGEVAEGGEEEGGVTTNPSGAEGEVGEAEVSTDPSEAGPGEDEGPSETDSSTGEQKFDIQPPVLDVNPNAPSCWWEWIAPELLGEQFPGCTLGPFDPNLYPEYAEICVDRPEDGECADICGDELCEGMEDCLYATILDSCGIFEDETSCCAVVASEPLPPVGRPFVVAGEPRLADDATQGLGQLAAHWLEMARGEHASVAAFARFVAVLQAHAAPAQLVAAAVAAAADELRHAETARLVAEEFGGERLAFGPLRVEGALAEIGSLAAAVRATLIEGCIGETCAAHEAACLAAFARSPELRAKLERIAADELRHAALAWRFVSWALEHDPSVAAVVRGVFAERVVAVAGEAARPQGREPLLDRGCPSPGLRGRWRAIACSELVAPCIEQLLVTKPSARVLGRSEP